DEAVDEPDALERAAVRPLAVERAEAIHASAARIRGLVYALDAFLDPAVTAGAVRHQVLEAGEARAARKQHSEIVRKKGARGGKVAPLHRIEKRAHQFRWLHHPGGSRERAAVGRSSLEYYALSRGGGDDRGFPAVHAENRRGAGLHGDVPEGRARAAAADPG